MSAPFLYYFPGHGSTKSQLTREDVAKTFAKDALWDVLHTQNRFAVNTVPNVLHHGGPDQGVGTLLFAFKEGLEPHVDFIPGYFPDKQQWLQVGAVKAEQAFDAIEAKNPHPDKVDPADRKRRREAYVQNNTAWLGWYTDKELRPGPESLLRLWPVAGELVELGDGNEWQAPIIRQAPRRQIQLPQNINLKDDDSIELETKPEFAEFEGLSDRIWDHYWGTDGRTMTSVEVLKSVINCLNLNYRIGRVETRVLRLLDNKNWELVFRASNNFRLIEELLADDEKKDSRPKPSAQSAGQKDSTKPAEVSGNSTSPQ